jgi:hypothetical protein
MLWFPGDLIALHRELSEDPLTPAPPAPVSLWLRNSATSGGVAAWDNVLNAANPAVQATATRQPTADAAFALTFDGGDDFAVALDTTIATPTAIAVAFWIKLASTASPQALFAIRNLGNPDGASSTMFELRTSGTALVLDIFSDGTNGRRATAAGVLTAGTPVFVTAEFNGALGTEAARHVITTGTTVRTLSFVDLGTGGTITSLTPGVTGNANIGSRSGLNLPVLAGTKYGRNFFGSTSPESGVPAGVWLPASRTALSGLEAVT